MKKLYSFYENALIKQKEALNLRSLKPLEIEGKYIFQDGKKLLNLGNRFVEIWSSYESVIIEWQSA